MANLHLHLRFGYFDAIERGEKTEEYRRADYWLKRLENREFGAIVLWRGYTKTFMVIPYLGYTRKTITHPHFGCNPTEVLAIDVSGRDVVLLA